MDSTGPRQCNFKTKAWIKNDKFQMLQIVMTAKLLKHRAVDAQLT